MTRSVLGGTRLLGIALAIAMGCGGSLGGNGGHGGKGGGAVVGAGGAGALALTGAGGLGGNDGGCAICSNPTADVAGCPAGTTAGASCSDSQSNAPCCTGNQQLRCGCNSVNECIWIATCGGAGGVSGAGGAGGFGGSPDCTICSRPTGHVSACPAGVVASLPCAASVTSQFLNGFCCAGGQQLQCECGTGNADCLWTTTCEGTGGKGNEGLGGNGLTGAGGVGGGAGGPGAGGQGGSGGTGSGGQGGGLCNGTTCAAGQLCVHPSCASGVGPGCLPLPDGGVCPAGWQRTDFCSPTGPACVLLPCDSPPAFCTDVPPACAGNPSCGCLPSDICTVNGGNGSCGLVTTTDVMCGSA